MSPDALLEREAELATVAELVRDTRAGRGGVLMVEGLPGLGKSALLAHGAEAARAAGLLVLTARGHELERAFPWGVARALFEAEAAGGDLLIGPAAPAAAVLGSGIDEPGDAFSILYGLYWLAVRLAERQPLLLVVDDAQWADEPSLRFLVYLAGRVPALPAALLVAARPDEGEVLARLAGDPVSGVLALAPLSAAAVADLVHRRMPDADAGVCARCSRLTGGNPLYLRALLAALERHEEVDLAAGAAARVLARSVLRRLAALSPAAGALTRAVAVFEDEVPLHQAAALAGLGSRAALIAADELVAADVLRPGDPLGFIHPLLRASVYGALSPRERADRHAAAARLLAEAGAPLERVSAHLLEAAPTGSADVVSMLRAASRRALAQAAPASAADYLARALREPPGAGERATVLAELGRAEAMIGRPDAHGHLEAALALLDEPGACAALRLDLARILNDRGQLAEACSMALRGLDELDDADGELALALEGAYLTPAMFERDHAREANARAAAILARAGAARTPGERALLSKAMIMRLWAGHSRDEVLAVARRLFADGRLVAERGAESQALWHVMGALGFCDDYSTAERAVRLALADARHHGAVASYAAASVFRARVELWAGPLADAVEDGRAAVEIWRDAEHMYVPAAAYCMVAALLELGRTDEARTALTLIDERPASSGWFAAWGHMARGRLAAHDDDLPAALEAFLATGARLEEVLVLNPTVLPWRSEAALAAARLGRHDQARALVEDELALAERFGGPRALGVARRAAALLARGDAAVELLRSAAADLASCGARVEQARALIDLGAAIRRAGSPSAARATLREGVALAMAVGGVALADRGRAELRLAGGRAPAAADGAAALTPSERRVAELAAAGHTNRQIADALFVTIKAVEWHLSNTYRKLDVRGRAELPAALGESPESLVRVQR